MMLGFSLILPSFALLPQASARTDYGQGFGVQYAEHSLQVPIDHFWNDSLYEPHSNDSFDLRYWLESSYYKEGGPVILLLAGEAPGERAFPNLHHGIVSKLAKETGGLAVLLEHRYYGNSLPFSTSSTDNLRFLTTAQALADTAYFAEHVDIPALTHLAPWIVWGTSYAGACAAFLRKLYPHVFFGAIASSPVTQATIDYWRYYEAVQRHGPAKCIENTQLLTDAMDNIFTWGKNEEFREPLKALLGPTDADDAQFMYILAALGIAKWQGLNWDTAISSPDFNWYCGNVSSQNLLYPSLRGNEAVARRLLEAGGYEAKIESLWVPMLNWFGFSQCIINRTMGLECSGSLGQNKVTLPPLHDQEDEQRPFSSRPDFLAQFIAYDSWRYQLCTQWGFFLTSPPHTSQEHLPLVSRLSTTSYFSSLCRDNFNVTTLPNVSAINGYGGWGISYPRLAIVDGAWDSWKETTPHAQLAPTDGRGEKADEPWWEIESAGHGWDGNGLEDDDGSTVVPKRIREVQEMEVSWVKDWVKEWNQLRRDEL